MRTGVRTLRRTGFGACFPKCSMPAAGLFEPELPEKAARNPAEKSCFTAGHGTTTHIAAPNALGKAFFSHFWAEKRGRPKHRSPASVRAPALAAGSLVLLC